MFAEAINRAGEDREAVIRELHNIKDYQGAFGNVVFDENGDADIDLPIRIIEDGVSVVLEI